MRSMFVIGVLVLGMNKITVCQNITAIMECFSYLISRLAGLYIYICLILILRISRMICH